MGSPEAPVPFPNSIQMGKSVDRCIIFCGRFSGNVCPGLLVLFIYSSYLDWILSKRSASILLLFAVQGLLVHVLVQAELMPLKPWVGCGDGAGTGTE